MQKKKDSSLFTQDKEKLQEDAMDASRKPLVQKTTKTKKTSCTVSKPFAKDVACHFAVSTLLKCAQAVF